MNLTERVIERLEDISYAILLRWENMTSQQQEEAALQLLYINRVLAGLRRGINREETTA